MIRKNKRLGKSTEADIIDVLLGQASARVQDAVESAAEKNREFTAVRDYWTSVLGDLRKERSAVEDMSERVHARVMRAVRPQRLGHASAQALGYRFRGPRNMALGGAAAACVLGLAYVVSIMGRDPGTSGASAGLPVAVGELDVVYVNPDAAEGPALGTKSQPLRTFEAGLAAVRPGGTMMLLSRARVLGMEKPQRITKPVRLESQADPVQAPKGQRIEMIEDF